MCHHHDTSELAEWERLFEAESDEESSEDEGDLAEDATVTPPADD